MLSRLPRFAAVISLAVLGVLIAVSLPACVADDLFAIAASGFHVAQDGDDANDGSRARPWRTIQRAADALRPGETVYVHDGVYAEQVTINVSGNLAVGPVTFAAYPGARPILDGTGIPIPEENAALIRIEERAHVVIDGFELRNWKADAPTDFPTGILVLGSCVEITIRDCVVHDLGNNLPALDGDGPFANGIAVYGTRMEASRGIRIEGCELYDLETGGSEALVINGNVDGFAILDNNIHHVNNIAIDCIGFEGTAPSPAVDFARNGIVAGNLIEETSGRGNAYYDDPYGALGIYVDGGRDLRIERNTVRRTDFGIEISSEHTGRRAERIVVAGNLIAESRTAGLSVGGWIETWGGAAGVVIVNNTFVRNNSLRDARGEVAFLRHLDDVRFVNNVVLSNDDGAFLLNEARTGDEIRSESNLFFGTDETADGLWIWNGVEIERFSDYRHASGNDATSIVEDPRFVDPDRDDFHLRAESPCIDAGDDDAALGADVRTDLDGDPRPIDGDRDGLAAVDLGADEFQPASD